MSQPRALVAVCPDWPVVVAGRLPSSRVVVVRGAQVVATSPGARALGALQGQRLREAQLQCHGLEVVQQDLAGEARRWEPVVAAVEAFAPGVEVLGPGQLALGSRGPSRYFGGDVALAAKVASAVEGALAAALLQPASQSGLQPAAQSGPAGSGWEGCCQVAIADGLFAAAVTARLASSGHPVVVPTGQSPALLAPLPLQLLEVAGLPGTVGADFSQLVDLLGRLGLKTLGDLAALPQASVLGRFGTDGLLAHRLSRGLDGSAVRARLPPPDWVVSTGLDPPADKLEAAAFAGKALAGELYERLARAGLVCTRLAVEAETEHGAVHRRSWRCEGALSAAAIGERVRWQLEGWSQAAGSLALLGGDGALGGAGPATGLAGGDRVVRLTLVPEEVCCAVGPQLDFWGGDAAAAARAGRAAARVQSLLGPEGVFTAVLQGGRGYREQARLVPWGEPGVPARAERARTERSQAVTAPWPGRMAGLAPAVVHPCPLEADLVGPGGAPVAVSGRGVLSSPPELVVVACCKPSAVIAWAGPWPVEERWWDASGRRLARLQVSTQSGESYLLAREKGRWWVEATYD